MFQFGGTWSFVWGMSPPRPPVATGLVRIRQSTPVLSFPLRAPLSSSLLRLYLSENLTKTLPAESRFFRHRHVTSTSSVRKRCVHQDCVTRSSREHCPTLLVNISYPAWAIMAPLSMQYLSSVAYSRAPRSSVITLIISWSKNSSRADRKGPGGNF